jgi:glyoxylase-like metal-dependent hydrolase (beta-lactamase superfamily II)
VRVAAAHRDALVVTSRLWQTNAVALRAGGEALVVDSPYFPDELEALPDLLASSGFSPNGLLATHGDYDHLLGRLAFPSLSLGVAESTMLRLRAEPGAAQRELREADAELYLERSGPLALGQLQALPVPGKLELGSAELELHPTEGHTSDGLAVMARESAVLVCGDYLSDVEIPSLGSGGSVPEYRATLARLRQLVEAAETVVPGHGSPRHREAALRILDEDLDYLDALERREERPRLPPGRDSPRQRAVHAENLRALG